MNAFLHTSNTRAPSRPMPDLHLHRAVNSDPDLLLRVLDEIDYGLCVVTEDGFIEHANQIATDAISEGSVLLSISNRLRARDPSEHVTLCAAMDAALRGRRGLVVLGKGTDEYSLALTPLTGGKSECQLFGHDTHPKCLLVMGRRSPYEQLSLIFFARAHGLTPAEIVVLEKLCNGDTPKVIAAAVGVAVSTVRTQISSVRSKTQTESIRDLARRISALPPVTMLLKPIVFN